MKFRGSNEQIGDVEIVLKSDVEAMISMDARGSKLKPLVKAASGGSTVMGWQANVDRGTIITRIPKIGKGMTVNMLDGDTMLVRVLLGGPDESGRALTLELKRVEPKGPFLKYAGGLGLAATAVAAILMIRKYM